MYAEETIALFARAGDQSAVARNKIDLAEIAIIEADFDQAAIILIQSLTQVQQFGDKWSAAQILDHLAELACEQGNYQRAALFLGAAETLSESISMLPLISATVGCLENNLSKIQENLSQAAFKQAWKQGCSMSLKQLVSWVSNETESFSPDMTLKEKYGGLTAREREAAVLIAQGKSNREIAEEMTISIKTVETYVTRILKKLGFESRVQIATWAIENDLR